MADSSTKRIAIIVAAITAIASIISALIMKWPSDSEASQPDELNTLISEIQELRKKVQSPASPDKSSTEISIGQIELEGYLAAIVDAIRNIGETINEPKFFELAGDIIITQSSARFPPGLIVTSRTHVTNATLESDVIILNLISLKSPPSSKSIVVENFTVTQYPSELRVIAFNWFLNQSDFSVIKTRYLSDSSIEVTVKYGVGVMERVATGIGALKRQ